jgi:hypothetical protein
MLFDLVLCISYFKEDEELVSKIQCKYIFMSRVSRTEWNKEAFLQSWKKMRGAFQISAKHKPSDFSP